MIYPNSDFEIPLEKLPLFLVSKEQSDLDDSFYSPK